MTDIVIAVLILAAVLFFLAFVLGACRVSGEGEGGE